MLESKIIPDTWFSGLVYLPLECVVLLQQFSENKIYTISNRCDSSMEDMCGLSHQFIQWKTCVPCHTNSFNGRHVWPVTPIHSMEDMCGLSKQCIQWKGCVDCHSNARHVCPVTTVEDMCGLSKQFIQWKTCVACHSNSFNGRHVWPATEIHSMDVMSLF